MGEDEMNILIFNDKASDLGSIDQFELFRAGAENYYNLYCRNREKEYAEKEQEYVDPEKFVGSEDEEMFFDEWAYISLSDITKLYSELGVKMGAEFGKTLLRCNMDGVLYYPQDFKDAYKIIQMQKDDIDFCYGLLILISHIPERQKIYEEYVIHVKELLRKHGLEECERIIGNTKKKAFIAIWFDNSMEKAREKIMVAIRTCGYEPMIIDIKEHNNQIVPEIFKEIEDSEFVVADLTGHRGGVYYEAGYAMAKKKQVILSCKDGERTHFDVAQINTIYWKDEDELCDRLVKRIKATIGENR